MFRLSDPTIIERAPYRVVGVYCTFDGDDEGPGWAGAHEGFFRRLPEVTNRTDDMVLGFLYRPCRDDRNVPENVRACFVGVEVTDLDHVPPGMATTCFSGGEYVIVASEGDRPEEAANGVGGAIGFLEGWIAEHGYTEGDACFAASHQRALTPPYVEHVYMRVEKRA